MTAKEPTFMKIEITGGDQEIDTMIVCKAALNQLDEDQQERVIKYLVGWVAPSVIDET